MAKTAIIQARIDPEIKNKAQNVFKKKMIINPTAIYYSTLRERVMYSASCLKHYLKELTGTSEY